LRSGKARDGRGTGEKGRRPRVHQLGRGFHVACAAWFQAGQNVGGPIEGSLPTLDPPSLFNIKQRCSPLRMVASSPFPQNPGELNSVFGKCSAACMASPLVPLPECRSPAGQTRIAALVENELATGPDDLARLAALPEGSLAQPLARTRFAEAGKN